MGELNIGRMTPLERRFALFLLGCVPARLALVLAALVMPMGWLRVLALAAGAMAVAFWVLFLGDWRKTGPETGGAPIWWGLLRPVHGTLWALAAYFAWRGERAHVWRLLLADVVLGLASFGVYHGLRAYSS